jgi:hypothetical protein
MNRSLVIGTFLLVLFIAGCYASPAAPGPAGPQGQSGATGQDGDRGHDRDRSRAGDQGREGRTGDQGREGQAAPCPAREHRFTDPNTGAVRCVRD